MEANCMERKYLDEQIAINFAKLENSIDNLAYLYPKKEFKESEFLHSLKLEFDGLNKLVELFQKNYGSIRETKLCQDRPDLVPVLNQFVSCYWLESLKIQETKSGCSFPDLVPVLSNLISYYRSQGKQLERELYIKALRLQEKQLEEKGPDSITVLCNLASIFYARGKTSIANLFLEQVLETRNKKLGV